MVVECHGVLYQYYSMVRVPTQKEILCVYRDKGGSAVHEIEITFGLDSM